MFTIFKKAEKQRSKEEYAEKFNMLTKEQVIKLERGLSANDYDTVKSILSSVNIPFNKKIYNKYR